MLEFTGFVPIGWWLYSQELFAIHPTGLYRLSSHITQPWQLERYDWSPEVGEATYECLYLEGGYPDLGNIDPADSWGGDEAADVACGLYSRNVTFADVARGLKRWL